MCCEINENYQSLNQFLQSSSLFLALEILELFCCLRGREKHRFWSNPINYNELIVVVWIANSGDFPQVTNGSNDK